MASDEQLMERYLDGDREAFRELFEKYAPKLRRLFARKIDSDHKVEELLQQTFLQLHRARRDFDTGRELRPWLYTIALNLRRDHRRKASEYREVPLEAFEKSPVGEGPTRDQENIENQDAIEEALEQLDEKKRRVVELHWFQELKYREIAELLDITESAAKVRAHRAHKKMRAFLESNNP